MEGPEIHKAAASAVSQSKALSAGDLELCGCSAPVPAAKEGTERRENPGKRESGSGKAGVWLPRKLRPLPRGLCFGDPII